MPNLHGWGVALAFISAGVMGTALPVLALPPEEDIPEEVLRTRVITEARSPIDGEPMSAAAYGRLQEQLQNVNDVEVVDSDLAQLIFLLQIRRAIRPILPFIP
jgi:hypothetical protein